MEERQKIKNNIIKLSHSIVVSGLSSAYLYESNLFIKNLIFFISSTYFYYDSKLLLKCDKIDYPMLYHHILALLLLFGFYIDYYGGVLIYLYNLGELSNIPMYITYHLRKTSPNMNLIVCSNVLQTLFYGYFRVYCFTRFLIKHTYLMYTPLVPLLGIYLMGLVWFYTLCKQVYEERVTIKYIILDRFLQNV
tara:strand:+ start:1992 stop:2567 length:576 start_codon:yes stop_codon:yes gene_type:complete